MTHTGPRWFVAMAALIAALASGCSGAAPEEIESDTVVPVAAEAAALGDITALIPATGTVTAAPGAELIVVAPEPARVAEIPKGEGDRVAQGDLLVRFDIPAAGAALARQQAEIERAGAQLVNAVATQVRARELFDRGVAARKEMEDADRDVAEAQAAIAQGQASLAAAQSAMSRATVRAPFSGVVIKRFHNPGDVVEAAAADPVLRLVDPGRLEVTASIPVGDVARIVMASAARVIGTDGMRLTVASRPMAVNPATGSVPLRLTFVAPAPALAVGTPLQIAINAETRTGVVLVPTTAIVREGEEAAVMVAADGKAIRRVVVLGLAGADRTEVRSGLKAGELVITRGQAGLPDGAAIALEAAKP